MNFSIIIPCHNEAGGLAKCIQAARHAIPGAEIIIVDGGSNDGTWTTAEGLADHLLQSPARQRAAQMNLGATKACGEILLFLHADTQLPPGARESLETVLRRPAVAGGGFARRFDSPSVVLSITSALAEARCRALGWFLGDQAIFVRKILFDRLGGFRGLDRFEDLDFVRRLKGLGSLATVRPPVLTSARRFAREGALLRTWRDFVLTIRYLRGEPDATRSSPA
jgi:rSAM/selenodomain-associated transferase 2